MAGDRRLRLVFQHAFTVQDIAQPLLSFDGDALAEDVSRTMRTRRCPVAGVRTDGLVTRFVEEDSLTSGRCNEVARPIETSQLVTETASLASLVIRFQEQRWLFVQSLGQVGGVVSRYDFLQAPGRMWLFGMVTLLEMRFSQMIQQRYPGDSWHPKLSAGRLEKAHSVLADRSRRNPNVGLIDCIQWTDKIEIIAGDEGLRKLTRFDSKSQIRDVGKQLERLRNNLAHSQDIITDGWETIVALAENLDSVITGPTEQLRVGAMDGR